MGSVSLCTSCEFVVRTVSTTSAHVLPTELRLWLFVRVAIRQILMMRGLERLVMIKSRLVSLGIWVVGFHFCMRIMLVLIMVLILLDKHVVMLVLLLGFLALGHSMLVSWLRADGFNLGRSIVLSLVKLLMDIWFHLQN